MTVTALATGCADPDGEQAVEPTLEVDDAEVTGGGALGGAVTTATARPGGTIVIEPANPGAATQVPSEAPPGSPATVPALAPPPPMPAEPAMGVQRIVGTYAGFERWELDTGRCPAMDHSFEATIELADGQEGRLLQLYCGHIVGDVWTGEGTFLLTAAAGDTLSGRFASQAVIPSEGEPYTLEVNDGTGAFDGARGTCWLDNHLRESAAGEQEQFGSLTCDVAVEG
jgi:hypothetical protein